MVSRKKFSKEVKLTAVRRIGGRSGVRLQLPKPCTFLSGLAQYLGFCSCPFFEFDACER
jgi:hypothetical protein